MNAMAKRIMMMHADAAKAIFSTGFLFGFMTNLIKTECGFSLIGGLAAAFIFVCVYEIAVPRMAEWF